MRSMVVALLATGFFSGALAADSDAKARIVIMRMQQGLGSKSAADILEVKDGRAEYIGRLWQGEKLVLEATPGRKQYMTMGWGNKGGEMLFTEPLTPGKTYYVLLKFHNGTGAMVPIPLRTDNFPLDPQAAAVAAKSTYKLVVPSKADADAFANERNSTLVQAECDRINALYARKTPAQVAERTLRPEDSLEDDAAVANFFATTRQSARPRTPEPPAATNARLLEQLNVLLDRGMITKDEYEEKRKAILSNP